MPGLQAWPFLGVSGIAYYNIDLWGRFGQNAAEAIRFVMESQFHISWRGGTLTPYNRIIGKYVRRQVGSNRVEREQFGKLKTMVNGEKGAVGRMTFRL